MQGLSRRRGLEPRLVYSLHTPHRHSLCRRSQSACASYGTYVFCLTHSHADTPTLLADIPTFLLHINTHSAVVTRLPHCGTLHLSYIFIHRCFHTDTHAYLPCTHTCTPSPQFACTCASNLATFLSPLTSLARSSLTSSGVNADNST